MGCPTDDILEEFPVSIRLGLDVQGGSVQFCDLFWLSDWDTKFPQNQMIPLADGYYEMTVCTFRPKSGYWGDNQTIYIYFNKVEQMPEFLQQRFLRQAMQIYLQDSKSIPRI